MRLNVRAIFLREGGARVAGLRSIHVLLCVAGSLCLKAPKFDQSVCRDEP